MLSRRECLEILGLDESANRYDIENRYTTLLKRYRGQYDDETRDKVEKLTLAYSILTDRYVEPEPVDPRMEEVVWGKSRRDWKNLWHYGRLPILSIILVASFVIYIIYNMLTQIQPDFKMVVAGPFSLADDAYVRVDQYVEDVVPELVKFEFQNIPLDMRTGEYLDNPEQAPRDLDIQNQYAYMMKMLTIVSVENIDVFVVDELVFDAYSRQGAFLDLEELYLALADLPDDVLEHIQPKRRPVDDPNERRDIYATPTPGPSDEEMNQDSSLQMFGIDVTGLDTTEGLGIYENRQILTIGHNSDDPERAMQFLETWIRDYERMHEQRETYEREFRERFFD